MRRLALILFLASTAYGQSSEDQSPAPARQSSVSLNADSQPTQGDIQGTAASHTWLSTGMPAISLRAGDLLRIPAEGATAAYATDVLYVDVTLDDGVVQVLGKFAGHTEVIIVTDAGARNV